MAKIHTPAQKRRIDGAIILAWCAALLLTFGLHAVHLSQYHSVWSPDSGALYLLAKSYADGGSPVHPKYGLESFDPTWLIHPLYGAGYVVQTSHGHALVYGPTYPVLTGACLRFFGFVGLTFPSIAAGVFTTLAALLTAREMRLRLWWLIGIIGLATPVAVYSVVFWHHALTICSAAWAFYFLVRMETRGEMKAAVWAGLSLGIGLFIHELSLALAIACILGLIPKWPVIGRFVAGFGAAFVPWAGMNFLLYGRPMGPHVSGANDVLTSNVYRPGLFDLRAMLDRGSVQLFGFSPDDRTVWVMAGCILCACALMAYRRHAVVGRYLRFALIGAFAVAACATWPRDTVNNGLLQTTPLFALALIAPTSNHPGRTLTLRACVIFAVLVILNPIPPLMGWGSRFLMTVASPLACLAIAAAEEGGGLFFLAPLILLGFSSQHRGLSSVEVDLSYSRNVWRAVQSFRQPVIMQTTWIGPECEVADVRDPLIQVGDTFFNPIDRKSARAKAIEYLKQFRPPSVIFYGPGDPNAPMDAEIEEAGYRISDRGAAGGQPFTRYRYVGR